jgi:ABC-type antimicrobial peptide transport system permease subunit
MVMPQIYSSIDTSSGIASDIGVAVVVRTRGAPTASIEPIRAAIHELQPAVAIFNIKTMRQLVDESMWELNLYRWLIGLFAALALVITAIGLFGVISYSATARSREFAIRLALGSDQSRLARVVLIRGITLTVIGLALGGVSSVAVLQLLAAFVARSRPDPFSVASICALLLAIAVAACLWPAIRVARIDPVKVLRSE